MRMRLPFIMFLVVGKLRLITAADLFLAPISPPGNFDNTYPFLVSQTSSIRYQQVYSANSFSAIAQGGGLISTLWFIAGGGDSASWGSGYGTTISEIQINLSTTSRGVDSLSPVFAENVGIDDRAVVPRTAFYHFNAQVQLAQQFQYDPSKGNLLLDVRVFSGIPNGSPPSPSLDAQNTAGDPVSRAYALGVDGATAEHFDTAGLLTAFTITPVPEPSTLCLLGAGLTAISVRLWRTSSKNKPKQQQ